MPGPLSEQPDALKIQQFLDCYATLFAPFAARETRILELGIYAGGSLRLWRDYFERGVVVGLDAKPVHIDDPTGRIHVYQGLQQDTALLDRIGREMAPAGFDIIIDDCSHIAELTSISFWHLFDHHLRVGGLYVIEDWGTGYLDDWPDGRRYSAPNHLAGMVGFVKELVDECSVQARTCPHVAPGSMTRRRPTVPSKFQWMLITPGQVFIAKAPPGQPWNQAMAGDMNTPPSVSTPGAGQDGLSRDERLTPRDRHIQRLEAQLAAQAEEIVRLRRAIAGRDETRAATGRVQP